MGDINRLLKAISSNNKNTNDEISQLEAEYDAFMGDESSHEETPSIESNISPTTQPWEQNYLFPGQTAKTDLTDPLTESIKSYIPKSDKQQLREQIQQQKENIGGKAFKGFSGPTGSLIAQGLARYAELNPKAKSSEQGLAEPLKYSQAYKNIEEAEKALSAPQKADVNSFSTALSALGKGLVDIDAERILSAGWSDVSNSLSFKRIADKLDKGQEPTESEIALLESELLKNSANKISDPSLLYSASQSIGENVPFIIQMLYTGGVSGAVSKGAQKVLTRLGEKYGMKMAEKGAKKVAQQIGKKALANIPAAAATVPLTSMFYDELTKNLTGNLTRNEQGDFEFINPMNFIAAAGKAGNNTLGEVYFEIWGDLAKQAMKSLPLRKLFKSLPKGSMSDMYRSFSKSTKFSGFGYELMEEELNGLYSGLTTGDQSIKDFFSTENQKQVAASVLAMSFGFGMLQAPGKVMDWNDYRNKERAFNSIQDNDVVNQVKEALSKPSYSEQVDGLKDIDYSGLTDTDRRIVTRYIIARQKKDLYTGWKEDEADEESTPLRHDVTGDIHPVLINDETDEEAEPTPAFLLGDSDEGLSFVFNPQTSRVEPIDPHLIEHQEVIPYQDWIQANADISVQQEEEIVQPEEQVIPNTPTIQEGQNVNLYGKNFVVTSITGNDAYIEEVDENGNIMEDGSSGNVPVSTLMPEQTNQEENVVPEPQQTPYTEQVRQGTQPEIQPQTTGGQNVAQPQQKPSFDVKLKGNISKATQQDDGSYLIEKAFDTEKEAQKEINYLNEKLGKRGFTFETVETLADPANPFSDSYFNIKINSNAKEVRTNETAVPEPGTQPEESRNESGQDLQQPAETRRETGDQGNEINQEQEPVPENNIETLGDVAAGTDVPEPVLEPIIEPEIPQEVENISEAKPETEIEQKDNADIAKNSTDKDELFNAWIDEKSKAPYNLLPDWQKELLTMKVNKAQFDEIVGNVDTGYIIQSWFNDSTENDINNISQHLSETHNIEVTPQNIVDFIIFVPNRSVRKTTDTQLAIEKRFKKVTGMSITKYSKQLIQDDIINDKIAEEEEKVNTEPTEAQKESGNYEKGHVSIQGLDISIENPKGSTRSGIDSKGNPWETLMNNTYGYIKGTKGRDKDHIDVFIGENPSNENVYVIDQINPDTGQFDEHKVMLGFTSEQEASDAYLSNYQPGWKGLGAIIEMPIDKFKEWTLGDTTDKPLSFKEKNDIVYFTFRDGATRKGEVISEKEDKLKVKDENGITYTISKNDLLSKEDYDRYTDVNFRFSLRNIIFHGNIEKRKQELQDYYDSINRGSPIVVVHNNKEVIEDYKNRGGESEATIHELMLAGEFQGVYLADINIIYAISNAIDNKEEANDLWVHENGIHFGIKNFIPEQDKRIEFLNRLFNSLDINQLYSIVPEHYFGTTYSKLGEEYLAFLAEKLRNEGKIDLNNIFTKDELYQIIPNATYSNEEIEKFINTFVNNSLNHVTNQENEDRYRNSDREQILLQTNRSRASENEGVPGRENYVGGLPGNEKSDTGQGGRGLSYRAEAKPFRYVGTLFNAIYTRPQSKSSDIDVLEEELPETIEVDGITRPTTNSEGKPIHTTLDGIRNFWEWFGNSQVIDNQGRPLVVYHGTESNFNVFQNKRISHLTPRNAVGYYFSDKNFADTYGGNVMPVYLKIENPYTEHKNVYKINPDTEFYTSQGYDGIITEEKKNPVWVIFNPNQAKSTSNVGYFDPLNPDIRFRSVPPRITPGGNQYVGDLFEENPKPFTPFVKTWADRQIENYQDKMLSVKRLVDEVINRGGTVEDMSNPYQEENLSAGRVKTEMENFEKNIFQPLLDKVSSLSNKASLEEINTYLMAKHAPERNEHIRKEKKDSTDENDYSGIASAETSFDKTGMKPDDIAGRIVKEFEAKFTPKEIKELWKEVKKNTDYTLDKWLKYGYLNQVTHTELKDRYQYYVPLRGWELTEEDQLHEYTTRNVGQEFNPLKAAKGRKSLSEGPLPYIANMANTAIVAGERNTVKQAAYRLAKANKGMNDLFELKKVYYVNTGVIDPGTGKEIWEERTEKPSEDEFKAGKVKTQFSSQHMARKPLSQAKEHEVEAMVNGEKFVVVFKDENVGRSINNKNLSDKALHIQLAFQESIGRYTRWLSANFTAKNPAFIPVNTMRDIAYAGAAHLIKGGFVDAWHFASTAGIFAPIPFIGRIGSPAKQAIIRSLKGKFDPNNKYDVWYKEFRENGGETGYIHLKDVDYFKRQIEREIKRANKENGVWDKMTHNRVTQWGGEILEHYAIRSENLSRFATYVVSREKGKTAKAAAYDAKEITVNFNRKGKYTGTLASLFAFFNAGVQGGANVIGLARKNTKAFTAVSLGFTSMGVMTALLNMMWAGDDDDYWGLSDYVRYNFLVLPGIKDGQFVTIPLPHFFRACYGLGVQSVEYAMGKIKPGEIIQQASSNFVGSVSPIDVTSVIFPKAATPLEILRPITPTVAVPFLDYGSNMDFSGRKIYKEPFTKDLEDKLADVGLSFSSVNPYLQKGFEKLYQLGGGDIKTKDKILLDDKGHIGKISEAFDWNPSNIEHWVEYYAGGRGVFYNDVIKVAVETARSADNIIRNDKSFGQVLSDFDFNKVPVWKRLYRTSHAKDSEEEYWLMKSIVSQFDFKENQLIESGQVDEVEKMYSDEKYVEKIMIFKAYDDAIQDLNSTLKDVEDKNDKLEIMAMKKELIQECINAIK